MRSSLLRSMVKSSSRLDFMMPMRVSRLSALMMISRPEGFLGMSLRTKRLTEAMMPVSSFPSCWGRCLLRFWEQVFPLPPLRQRPCFRLLESPPRECGQTRAHRGSGRSPYLHGLVRVPFLIPCCACRLRDGSFGFFFFFQNFCYS